MMSELAIHEPRSFKVCLQLCTERKELRKGARNEGVGETGASRDTGKRKSGRVQESRWECMERARKGDRKAGRAGRRETDPCR